MQRNLGQITTAAGLTWEVLLAEVASEGEKEEKGLWAEDESFIQAMAHVMHEHRDVRQVPCQWTQERHCHLGPGAGYKELVAVHGCT